MTDPAPPPTRTRLASLAAVLVLLLVPVALLGECILGGKKYLPFDPAEFAPIGNMLAPEQLAALRRNANYDASEPSIMFLPEIHLVREAVRAGQYPHWNPYARSGAPLMANGHVGMLNPLHWPALLFDDLVDGLLYLTAVMFALAGVLMFGLLRCWGLQPMAALFGALAFALSGTLTANGHWYMRLETIALLPGLLWACSAVAHRRGRARALPTLGLAACIALAWTAGFPPYCIPVCLITGAFGLLLVLRAVLQQGARGALELALWLGLGAALGLGLAAGQILPMAEFYPVSNRPPTPDLATISRTALDPMALLGYVLPDAFCHPGDRSLPGSNSPLSHLLFTGTEWGTGRPLLPNYNFTEYAVFPGTLTLFLAALGLLHRGPRFRFVAALGLAGILLLAMGLGPVHRAYTLPIVQAIPPYRFVGSACVLVAVLAALGFQALRGTASPWLLRLVAILGLAGAAACLWLAPAPVPAGAEDPWLTAITEHYRPLAPSLDPNLAPEQITPELVRQFRFTGSNGEDFLALGRDRLRWNLHRAALALALGAAFLLLLSFRGRTRPLTWWLGCIVLVFTAVELGQFGWQLNRGRDLPYPLDSPAHQFLRQQRDLAREQGGFMVARAHPGGEAWHMPPGTLAAEGLRDLNFYAFVDGRSSEPFRRLYGERWLLRGWVPGGLLDDERLRLPLYDLMGIRFLLSTTPLRHGGVQVGPELRGPGGDFLIYERTSALPRAFTVPALRVLPDAAAVLDAVLGPDLDPRAAVLVTPDQAALLGEVPAADGAARRAVRFRHDDQKTVVLEVDAGPACYLVLADTHLPGWRAWVDGEFREVARGNVYQRVLRLPAARCEVRFSYFTPGLRTGAAAMAASAVLCLVLLVIGLRRGRRAATADDVVSSP